MREARTTSVENPTVPFVHFTRTLGSTVMLGIMLFLSLPAATYAVDIIIDDRDPGASWSNVAGQGWHRQSITSAFRGSTLRTFNNTAWGKFTFGSLATGRYDIYLHWPVWAVNLPDNAARVIIKHSAGQQTVTVNQQQNGGQWNRLGSWTLDNTAFVTLTNRGAGPIYFDAVRLVPLVTPPPTTTTLPPTTTTTTLPPTPTTTTTLPPPPGLSIVIDDMDPGASWSNVAGQGWHRQSITSAFRGSTLRTFNNTAWGKFTFGSLATGRYDVYLHWPVWAVNLPDNAAPVIIKHSAGQQTVTVNQQQNGGQWNRLGSWTLDNTAFVTLTNRGAGPIYFDAARLVPLVTPTTTTTTLPPTPTTTTTLPPTPGLSVVGLSVQAHSGSFDAAGQAFTKELGAHSIRLGFAHGDYNFGVNWAAQNGVGVLFFFGYSAGCNPTTASGRQCYADRSANLAQTYGSKVQYYEVWNEWNGGIGLGCSWNQAGTPCTDYAMYTDLLCRTYTAVKAVQPNAIIVGGVTAGTDVNFISRMLDNGAGNCMDMVSVHPYVYGLGRVPYTASASVAVNRFVQEITNLDAMVRQKTGRTIPILVTEEGRSDVGNSSNEQLTADYITELYNRASSIPSLEGIWWFTLEDPTNDPSAVGYGLLRSNNAKKRGFAAYQAAAQK